MRKRTQDSWPTFYHFLKSISGSAVILTLPFFTGCTYAIEASSVQSHTSTNNERVVFLRSHTDGICSFSKRKVNERPYEYATRMYSEVDARFFYLDLDCLSEYYLLSELKDYADEGDYTAIFAINASIIDWNKGKYCNKEISLIGGEDINYAGRVRFRDYVPDYYLYIARVKSRDCLDGLDAYRFYVAAEMTGAMVPPTEKGNL